MIAKFIPGNLPVSVGVLEQAHGVDFVFLGRKVEGIQSQIIWSHLLTLIIYDYVCEGKILE